jgi:hypothetical protein
VKKPMTASGTRRKMRATWVVFATAIAMTAFTIAGTAAEASAPEPDGKLVFERANQTPLPRSPRARSRRSSTEGVLPATRFRSLASS